jgi:hypothetical protein
VVGGESVAVERVIEAERPGTSLTDQSRYMVYTSIRLGDLTGGLNALGSKVDDGARLIGS